MADTIARDVLLLAMKAGQVTIVQVQDDGHLKTVFTKGDLVEAQYLPELIPQRLVMRLLCKFDVPRDWAWHPDRIPAELRPPAPLTH